MECSSIRLYRPKHGDPRPLLPSARIRIDLRPRGSAGREKGRKGCRVGLKDHRTRPSPTITTKEQITGPTARARRYRRSEEHTSELQSRQYLVCRLLLEKKPYPSAQHRVSR